MVGPPSEKRSGEQWLMGDDTGILMGLPSGFIKRGWLEDPRIEWRFYEEMNVFLWCIFQETMFEYRRVSRFDKRYPLVN